MAIQGSRSLAEFFEDRAGPHLRLVAHYEDDDVEFVYRREDLTETYGEKDFEKSFYMHRRDRAAARQQADVLAIGDHHCTIRVYDEAIVFNVVQTDEVGTVISIDPSAGSDLVSFVVECLAVIQESSPQRVTVPEWVDG